MEFSYRVVRIFVASCVFFFVLPALSRASDDDPHSVRAESTTQDTAYYYETVPGKLMGIWPVTYTVEHLSTLRTRYGFTHVLVEPDTQRYNNALRAGFAASNIMMIPWNLPQSVDAFPAGIYYIDEPVEHDCAGHHVGGTPLFTLQELTALRDYIHQTRPGSLFVMSSYKRCSHSIIASTYADGMMYSSYQNWSVLGIPICHVNIGWGDDWESPWLSGSQDQRDSWTSMKTTYGGKFFMTWVHGGGTDEYFDLFAHANYLGLHGIWQYNSAPIDSANMESYCRAAWQNGWLNRVAQIPLVVQLSSFTAKPTGNNTVMLQWVTLSETNNYGFEVQRRSSSADTFWTVPNGFVPGYGTNLTMHEYSFVDSTTGPGRWSYRLKQIDLDGSVSYSPTLEVALLTGMWEEIGASKFLLEQNYPNPFNPMTTIEFSVPSARHATLRIVDMLGREVTSLVDKVVAAGTHRVEWNAEGRPSGVYLARFRAGDVVQTRKLILVK
jgi:hypothetical protein